MRACASVHAGAAGPTGLYGDPHSAELQRSHPVDHHVPAEWRLPRYRVQTPKLLPGCVGRQPRSAARSRAGTTTQPSNIISPGRARLRWRCSGATSAASFSARARRCLSIARSARSASTPLSTRARARSKASKSPSPPSSITIGCPASPGASASRRTIPTSTLRPSSRRNIVTTSFPASRISPTSPSTPTISSACTSATTSRARLAYNWRSNFVVDYRDIQGLQAPLRQDSLGQLDFSASYTPVENLTIAFDAINILAGSQPIRTYREFAGGNGGDLPLGTASISSGSSRSRAAPLPLLSRGRPRLCKAVPAFGAALIFSPAAS